MCGRFTLRVPAGVLVEEFRLDAEPLFSPRFNIAPTQDSPVIRAQAVTHARSCAPLRWGLVPSWADDPAIGNRMINARGETVAEKPSYRAAFAKRRCIVPADGYYEWKAEGKAKQPYLFHLAGNQVFGFAGLWEAWQAPDGSTLETFTIITTAANEQTQPYHDRMPVVFLPGEGEIDAWLSPSTSRGDLLALLATRPRPGLVIEPVSKLVNNPRNESPECVQPL